MANFDAQIQSLVGTADQTEMDTWASEAVVQLTNLFPAKLKQKCSQVTELSNATPMDLDSVGEILYVTRENANSGYQVSCRVVSPINAGLVEDSSSLHYATSTDPVYWIESQSDVAKLIVKPDPSSLQTSNVYHIGYTSVDVSSTDTIANFPDEAEYLVVLYAAIKVLQNKMNEMGGISDLSISASAPSAPSDPSISGGSVSPITIDALPSAPNYTAPTITTDGGTIELTTLVSLDAENTIDDFDGNAIEFDQWFSTVTHLIEDEEDVELANASLQKIQTYIQAYSSAMQNQLNIFNEGNAVYQAAVQRNLEQARINMQDAQKEADLTLQAAIQDYSLELQLFQQELALYQQNVNKEVTQYTTNLQQYGVEYQWLQSQQAKLQQDYDKGVKILIGGGVPTQQPSGKEE